MRLTIRNLTFGALLLLVAAMSAGSAFSQALDAETRFRLAQGLERSGDLDRAESIYRDLYQREPSNPVYFDALQRVLVQLKQYDDAILLIRSRLAANPSDITTRGLLGSVLYRAGRETDALREWDGILATDPRNMNVYRMLASIMIENRLLDRAADVYRKGRDVSGDKSMFSMELAQLLIATMDYTGATKELIQWLDRNPSQLGFVQNRMSAFTAKPEGRQAAIGAVQESLRDHEDARRLELLGWLYLEGNEFAKAFDTYRSLDRLASRKGGALYDFADRAYRAGAYEMAANAYREAIDVPLPDQRIPYALYGYAMSLKELGLQSDSIRGPFSPDAQSGKESTPLLDRAIDTFKEIIARFPRTEFSAKSYYQIGVLEYDRFFALDQALTSLGRAAQELSGVSVIQQQIILKIADILTVKGDTGRAGTEYRKVAGNPSATPDQIDEANFRLAELEYFGGRFDTASSMLAVISLNLKADYANDALELTAFLTENRTSPPDALKEYARADFLARQRRNSEAISLYHHVATTYPTASLADDALMNVALLQAKSGKYDDAVVTYQTVINQFKDHGTLLDRAQFRIGEVYQYGLRDVRQAIAAYEKLLADYPRSVFADEARKRIRELRGEA